MHWRSVARFIPVWKIGRGVCSTLRSFVYFDYALVFGVFFCVNDIQRAAVCVVLSLIG